VLREELAEVAATSEVKLEFVETKLLELIVDDAKELGTDEIHNLSSNDASPPEAATSGLAAVPVQGVEGEGQVPTKVADSAESLVASAPEHAESGAALGTEGHNPLAHVEASQDVETAVVSMPASVAALGGFHGTKEPIDEFDAFEFESCEMFLNEFDDLHGRYAWTIPSFPVQYQKDKKQKQNNGTAKVIAEFDSVSTGKALTHPEFKPLLQFEVVDDAVVEGKVNCLDFLQHEGEDQVDPESLRGRPFDESLDTTWHIMNKKGPIKDKDNLNKTKKQVVFSLGTTEVRSTGASSSSLSEHAAPFTPSEIKAKGTSSSRATSIVLQVESFRAKGLLSEAEAQAIIELAGKEAPS
jgi:hypothetical protein